MQFGSLKWFSHAEMVLRHSEDSDQVQQSADLESG